MEQIKHLITYEIDQVSKKQQPTISETLSE